MNVYIIKSPIIKYKQTTTNLFQELTMDTKINPSIKFQSNCTKQTTIYIYISK